MNIMTRAQNIHALAVAGPIQSNIGDAIKAQSQAIIDSMSFTPCAQDLPDTTEVVAVQYEDGTEGRDVYFPGCWQLSMSRKPIAWRKLL